MRAKGNAENNNEIDKQGAVNGTVISLCKMCRCTYRQPQCRVKRDKFCSRGCGDQFREKAAIRLMTSCPCCDKIFKARSSQLTNGNAPYCSISCSSKSQERSAERYEKSKATWEKNKVKHQFPTGEDHPSWKGGKAMSNGYVMVFVGIAEGKRKSVAEHRLVMEDYLGRSLSSDEIVHHINEIKGDNRIENLQIMTRAEHLNHHKNENAKRV